MNIQDKFSKGVKKHTYRRVDPEYMVDIFLGYNDNGQMSMAIIEKGNVANIQSSKSIKTTMRMRDDGKIFLSFDLLDNSFESVFLIFCKDMILTCEKAGSSMAISSALLRWKYWKEMFAKKRSAILDKTSIKGLLGELIEIKDYFIKKYGIKDSIGGWRGPLLGHKDFEIDDTWYEIKSVSENAVQVIISSLEQLESKIDGHLIIVRLEDTSSVADNAINVNDMVLSIINMIEDPGVLELFRTRLDNMGYYFDEEYNSYNFIYKGSEMYKITRDFPCLRRSDVPVSVGNAKYTIIINTLSDYREDHNNGR